MSRHALIDRLHRRLGLDRESIGTVTLNHAIDEACATLGCTDASELLRLVEGSEPDWQRFVDCMVIPETWFFRVPEQFEDMLRYARAELGNRRPIRILSLPCASGEEAYSIVASMLTAGYSMESISVLGIDVSPRLIEKARSARYGRNSLRGRPADPNWFHWEGDVLQPVPSLRRAVNFRVGNALHPGLFEAHERFDIVFCRNLLIYLDLDSRRQVISQILQVLEPPGLVLAGQAEVLSAIDSRLQPLAGYCPLSYSVQARASRFDEPTAGTIRPPLRILQPAPAALRKHPVRAIPHPPTAVETRVDQLCGVRRAADSGQLDNARDLCLKLLKVHPEWAEAWFLHGVIETALEAWDAAEEAFVRVSYLDRDHRDAIEHRAALAERRGRPEEASLLRSRLKRLQAGAPAA